MKKRLIVVAFVVAVLSAGVFYFARPSAVVPGPALVGSVVSLEAPLGVALLSHDARRVEMRLDLGDHLNVRYSRIHLGPANSHVTSPSGGLTPLMVASLGGETSVYWDWYNYQGLENVGKHWDNPAIVQTLLRHGANPNAADDQG